MADISSMEKNHGNYRYESKAVDFVETRYLHATQSQEMYECVAHEAERIGMKLNAKKTVILSMSAATSFLLISFIKIGGEKHLSGKKLLRFTFSAWPNCTDQINIIRTC